MSHTVPGFDNCLAIIPCPPEVRASNNGVENISVIVWKYENYFVPLLRKRRKTMNNVPYRIAVSVELDGTEQKVILKRLNDGKKIKIPYDYKYNNAAEIAVVYLASIGVSVESYASAGNGRGYILMTTWFV